MRPGLALIGLCWASVASASPVSVAVLPVAATAATWSWGETWSECLVTTAASLATQVPTGLTELPADLSACWRGVTDAPRDPGAPEIADLRVLSASPVPGVESSGFGWRTDPIHRRDRFHRGTDYRADRGTPVFAAGTGVVTFSGRRSGYGKCIYIDHGGGVVTRYAHLSRIEVDEGATIAAADRIGQVGSTGRATGPHLHFEVRVDGRSVDPVMAMHVAELQRTNPAAARIAGRGLAPEVQSARVDRHDPPRRAGAQPTRPDRPSRRSRSRVYW